MKAKICSLLTVASSLLLRAAVPVAWTNAPWMAPHMIGPIPHGSSIEFAVTLRGYTDPPIAAGADLRMWFQTNGMDNMWWSAPASLDGNVITSTFGPAQDTGADRVSLFFGAPSNAFAPAVLRLTHAPGFSPAALPLPVPTLDFTSVDYTNAPWLTGAEVDMRIQELAPRADLSDATNYTDAVAEGLAHDIQDGSIIAAAASAAELASGLVSDIGHRSSEEIFAELDAATTTNDVCNIVTNHIPIYGDSWTISAYPDSGIDQIELIYMDFDEASDDQWYLSYRYHYGGEAADDWQEEEDYMLTGDKDATYFERENYFILRRNIIGFRNALGLARIEDIPPGMATNDVCNIVTNVVVTPTGDWGLDETRTYWDSAITISEGLTWNGSNWVIEFYDGDMYRTITAEGGFDALELNFVVEGWNAYADIWYTRPGDVRNSLGLARLEDLPDTGNFATKDEVEDLEDAQDGFLRDLAANSNRVDNIAGSVNTLWSHVYGNSVWIAVTNYMRTIEGVVPSFQLWEVRDGATNCVYSSAEEIENTVTQKVNAAEARIRAAIPSPAWSGYQSATGAPNPQPGAVTIVSTPNVMLTGGGEWYKCIETASSSVWVLKSNGLCSFGGDTNGYFRIVDDEGTPQFEVVKTASFEVDAIASDTEFDASDNFTVTYNATMANPPTLYAAANLDDPFVGEDASHNINALGITVAWAKDASGYWVATVHQDSQLPRLFVHAKMLQEGQNTIRNAAPTLLEGGLIIGGVKYAIVPYTTGGKTYMTLEATP